MANVMNRLSNRASGTQRGFTLVEVSLVLLVIGLILGAVSIGKNVQRDAEYAKIKQKFVDQWVGSYNTHFQRTGVVLGDNQMQPRLMVNGDTYTGTATLVSGQDMTSVTEPNAICHGAAAPDLGRSADTTLHAEMDRHGIDMPAGRATGFEDRYAYLDTNGNPQEIQVCFLWSKPGTQHGSGNLMILSGLTPDLARSLDQMIDGQADALEGRFRQLGLTGTTSNEAGLEWAANNAESQAESTLLASGNGDNYDEDQVVTVVAAYKMNQ